MSSYAFGKAVPMGFEQAVEAVVLALGKEGFGVLTEIDVAATLRKKLGLEVPPYKILGACNPQFASRAIELEPQIGALLPCNVVVRQERDGATRVEVMDPIAVLDLVKRPEIGGIASEVKARLTRMLESL
ncbi:MAG TPA: DUF302 domain-containing protein [Gammaproteobacteria bacterium]|jgi:uncharacterized protein (DUF302 family)|nr:DUF302 domain-containing protein [Gammaproteobacteria bacterium]